MNDIGLIEIKNVDMMAVVDIEDLDRLSKYNWYHNKGTGAGSIHTVKRRGTKTKHYSMANLVMNKFGVMFDHADGDPYNNRKSNLRECSVAQNAWNKRKIAGCTSKYKGVFFNPANNNWRATIMVNGERHNVGSFKSEIDAAVAYNAMAVKLQGQFARLNVIPPVS